MHGKKTQNIKITLTVSDSRSGGSGRSFSLPGKGKKQIKVSRLIGVFVSSRWLILVFPLLLNQNLSVEPDNHPGSYPNPRLITCT